MKKIMFVLASIFLMVMAVASVSAEVTLKQVPLSHFGDAQVIDFEDAVANPDLDYLGKYGVSFQDDTGKTSAILVNSYNRGDATTSSGEYSLFSNGNYPATSANVPLTIEFDEGMSAVGFYLGNGNKYGEQVQGVVTAYGKSGKVLGMIAQNQLTDSVESFLGLQGPAEPIYKVTISYGNSVLGEEIDDLMFIKASNPEIQDEEESNKWIWREIALKNKHRSTLGGVEVDVIPIGGLQAVPSECTEQYNGKVCIEKAHLLQRPDGSYEYVTLWVSVNGFKDAQVFGLTTDEDAFVKLLNNRDIEVWFNPQEMKLRIAPVTSLGEIIELPNPDFGYEIGYGEFEIDYPGIESTPQDAKIIKEAPPTSLICPQSCDMDGGCLPFGTRLKEDNSAVYCDFDGELKDQKHLGAQCDNNYECGTNSCLSGQCVDIQKELEQQRGLIERILAWLNKLF